MANQCFLCGGSLRNGRCTACGMDNTKTDSNYRLNTHNDSGAHFHEGECDDNLNKKKKPAKAAQKVQKQQSESFNYQEMLEKQLKKTRNRKPKEKRKKKAVFWIVLIYLIVSLLSAAAEAVPGFRYEIGYRIEQLVNGIN